MKNYEYTEVRLYLEEIWLRAICYVETPIVEDKLACEGRAIYRDLLLLDYNMLLQFNGIQIVTLLLRV